MITLRDALVGRSNNLDLFRLIAASAVIFGHAPAITGHKQFDPVAALLGGQEYSGSLAVKLFFFISGLVVTNSFIQNRSIASWVSSRLFRLFPALAALLVVSAFVMGPLVTTLSSSEYWADGKPQTYVVNILYGTVMNCCYVWQLPGVFAGQPSQVINGSIWTLPSELVCYTFAAAMFLLFANRDLRLAGIPLAVILVASCVFPKAANVLTNDGAQTNLLLPCFISGMLLAIYRAYVRLDWQVALGLVMFAFLLRSSLFNVVAYCAAIFYGCLVIAAWKPLADLKPPIDVSYGVYLYGWPVAQLLFMLDPTLSNGLHIVLTLATCLFVGLLSYVLIERPAMLFRPLVKRTRTGL